MWSLKLHYNGRQQQRNKKQNSTKKNVKKIILKNDGHKTDKVYTTHTHMMIMMTIEEIFVWENESVKWVCASTNFFLRTFSFLVPSLSFYPPLLSISKLSLAVVVSSVPCASASVILVLHETNIQFLFPASSKFHSHQHKKRVRKKIVVAPPDRIWSSSTIFYCIIYIIYMKNE